MNEAHGPVSRAIESLESTSIEMLQGLVRIPSPMGSESAVQHEVARRMRALGLEVHVFDIDPKRLEAAPLFNRHARRYADRPCVVGVLKGKGGGKSLVLNAHADTAPIGDEARWTHPSSSAVIEDGWLHGRGSWDDKAGIAEMLAVAESFQRSGVRLAGDLVLASVVEDEESGNGSLACIERGLTGDAVVILDGTWPERYIVSHIGHVWFEVRLFGRGAPSSVASRGLNPMLGLGPLIDAFGRFESRKNNEDGRPWGNIARPYFLNIGRIEGGDYPGSVPREVKLACHYGFLPPLSPEQARSEIVALADEISRDARWPLEAPAEVRFYGAETQAFHGRAGSPLIETLRRAVRRERKADLIESPITGWCDLRHYESNPWRAPVPGCLYGPGGGKNAHIENEQFRISDFVPVSKILADVAIDWCGV
jgi:acetylornithine deacetylase